MKKTLIITLSILLFGFANAQNNSKLTKVQKKDRQKAVAVVLWDISGEKHHGYIYSADSSSITITRNYLTNTDLTSFNFNDIYRLKLSKKEGFGKVLARNSVISEGILLGTSGAIMLFGSEDNRFTALVSILIGSFAGAPINAMVTTTDMNFIEIDFINDSEKNENFILNNKFLQKNSLKSSDSVAIINKISVTRDADKLSRINIPEKKFHPQSTSLLHFTALYNQASNTLTSQFVDIFQHSDFAYNIWTGASKKDIRMNAFLKLSYSAKKNIRPYFSYQGNRKSFSAIHDFESSNLDINLSNSQLAFGVDYVFSPVNKMFTKKYELSAGAGLAMHCLHTYTILDREFPFKTEWYSAYGLNMNASFDYYVSRRFSISVIGGYNLMPDKLLNDISYFSETEQRNLEVKNIKINTSGYHIGFGMSLHLMN